MWSTRLRKVNEHHVDRISSGDRTYQASVSPTLSLLAFSIFTNAFYRRYVVSLQDQTPPDDDAAEGSTGHVFHGRRAETDDDAQGEKPRMSGAQRKKLAREDKKKRRGQNKGRRFQKVRDELDLCWKVAADEACEFGSECVQPVHRRVPVCPAEEKPDVGSRMMSRVTSPLSRGISSSQPPLTSPITPPL